MSEDWRVVLRDVDGTGIRAGDIGVVIADQRNGPTGGRWTQLAHVAVQVRFFRGAEIWFVPDELRPATPDEVSREKRRRIKGLD